MNIIRLQVLCLVVLLSIVATAMLCAAEPEPVFVERFADGAGDRWQIDSTLDPPCLRWHRRGEKPGFHFKSVAVEEYIKSHGYAWAEWNVRTRPFELCWDVQLERALEQNWFYPGVAVAMSSAPPGEMGEDDIAVTIGVHMGGLAAAVRQGGFYDLQTEGRGAYSNFRDRVLSKLIDRSSGGTASVRWPMKQPGGNRLRFCIRRTEDHTVQFTIRWPGLPGDRGRPYWTGEWQMPEEVAAVPLRYVCVKRMPVESVHISYAGFVMQGVVQNFQGRLLSAAPGPVIERFESRQATLSGGTELTLSGRYFQKGCRVMVGEQEGRVIRVSSERTLSCTLPDLPAGNRHSLNVVNPNGLVGDLKGGVPYGRMLEQVRPREALPAGDVVTVVGAGFEDATVFSFGGKTAELLKMDDPRHARVRVPAGAVGPAEVTARTGEDEFSGQPLFGYSPHPYLFFTADDIPGLREKFNKPMFRHYRRRVLEEAGKFLQEDVADEFNASVGATTGLAMAYTMTGEDKYQDKLMEWVRRGRLATRCDDFHMMSVAGMSIAYDILYPELSPEDRAAMQDYLDRMLTGYLKAAGGSWFLGAGPNFSNTVPVGNSGGMLAGLALMHSTPRAKEAVEIATKKARRYPDECISPDGGCREGVQYWDYGLSFHLILAHALSNTTGDDRGLLDHPHLRNNINFVRTQLGGHGGLFAFCDTREPFLDGFAICADLGSRYDQPLMLWVADRAAAGGEKTRARDTWAPFAFLWRSEQPTPEEFPGVPTLAWLKDMHWGAMRSDSSFKPQLVVGVKGSQGPLTHHKQHDLGSFVIHANGEAYLVDPGYYEGKATDHSLPLIDGKGPGVTGSRITDAWEEGPWRHMTLDSTDGYGEAAQRVRRLIVMDGADSVVVLDDIIPAKGKAGQVTAQYQTAWKPAVSKEDASVALIAGQKGKLELRCFGHPLALSATNRKFRKAGWCWEKISESGPGDWQTLSGTYQADPARPLVTVLQPSRLEGRLPPTARCHFAKGSVAVEFASGHKIRFEQKKEGWQLVRP